ncbi:MAG: hypothetical protein ACREXQ_09135, partial [Polaromonas sp.]
MEYDKNRYAEIVKILTDLISKQLIENIEITLTEGTVRARKGKREAVSPTTSRKPTVSKFVNRITIERGEEGYSFSALTNSAVIPVRKVNVQPFFTEGIAT